MITARVALVEDLHARPAAAIAATVLGSGASVTIARADDADIDASSVLALMAADFRSGSTLTLTVRHPAGDDVSRTIAADLAAIVGTERP